MGENQRTIMKHLLSPILVVAVGMAWLLNVLDVLAFRGFHAAVVADVKRFPMLRAFRADPLARGPEAKTVAVMVSARNDANFVVKGRAQEPG